MWTGATAPAAAIPTYPDSKSGLEHLLKDIANAKKESDVARAEAPLRPR